MGLSDQERETNLYWACHRIYNLGRKLDTKDSYPSSGGHLKELCDRVWVEFLGGHSNGAHWILGSSASNEIRDPDSPWSAALLSTLQESVPCHRYRRDEFDPFDGWLDIVGLLGKSRAPELAPVYEIFAWTEQAVYALRRYQDAYMRKRQGLSDLLATMQGVCFGIFRSDTFAKAYVHNRTLKKLYGSKYDKSTIRTILEKQNWHHDLSRPMSDWDSLLKIREWHYRAYTAETTTDKLLVLMEIVGCRYHYKHQLRQMCKMLREAGEKVDYKAIWAQFQKNEAAHKEEKGGGQEEYNLNHRREEFQAIHGYESWEYNEDKPEPFDPVLFTEKDEDGDEE